MTSYLLDTCIISEYVKKKPNKKVIEWVDNLNENNLFISILTLGELKKGITKLKSTDLNRYNKLSFWIKTIEERFSHKRKKTAINFSLMKPLLAWQTKNQKQQSLKPEKQEKLKNKTPHFLVIKNLI